MKTKEVLKLSFLILIIGTVSSCASNPDKEERPEWLIEQAMNNHRGGPISKHIIEGEIYWYFDNSRVCCDHMSDVFNSNGKYICSPKGGFTGRGSGNCPPLIRFYFGD